MTESDLPPEVDPRLRLVIRDGGGVAYFVGNPHTFRGRVAVFLETGREISVSKDEIEQMSDFAAVWLDGFLAGSEPPLPVEDDGDEEAEQQWDRSRRFYRSHGKELL